MNVRLILFAGLRQAAGFKQGIVSLPDAATVGDLLDIRVPFLRERTFYVAVNEEYAQRDTVLQDGDEVALLPPVSGGRMLFIETLAQDIPCAETVYAKYANQTLRNH